MRPTFEFTREKSEGRESWWEIHWITNGFADKKE